MLFCVQLFALRASSRCKHDVGTLSWLNAETVKRVPTPSLADLKGALPMGPFSRDYGTCYDFLLFKPLLLLSEY